MVFEHRAEAATGNFFLTYLREDGRGVKEKVENFTRAVFFKGFGSGRTQTWRDEKEREAIDAGWGGGTHSDTAGFLVR